MNNRKVAALVRKHKGHVVVDALVREDTLPVRVYKNDVLQYLAQTPDGDAFDLHVDAGTLYLHNATD